MRVGLFGISLYNNNKGVVALAYSAFNIIDDICNKSDVDVDYILFYNDPQKAIDEAAENIKIDKNKITIAGVNYKSIKDLIKLKNSIKSCDIVIDFTGGDSFSDIYGLKGMIKVSIAKIMTIKLNKKLILAPQTYGPYNRFISRALAKYIISNANMVLSRDKKSVDIISKLIKRDIPICTDVAFTLPYTKNEFNSDKIKVGINISALLYNGGFNRNNQFGLNFDYKMFMENVVEKLNTDNRYELHFIPHVIGKENEYDHIENDVKICNEFAEKYGGIAAPAFTDPIDAKSYISGMDIFIGARMHAAIASFSAGVPTIPISYSRKFDGLFNNIGYDYIIDCRKMDMDTAVSKTIEYVENSEELKKCVLISNKYIDRGISAIYTNLSKAFNE